MGVMESEKDIGSPGLGPACVGLGLRSAWAQI